MPKTGATRYQKFLKSEKSKTKLKAKKDLPKGTNVTKTNFKIKKIVIREQLKKHDDNDILSTRKLSVKELLSRLNHFNVNSRTEALNGIKELVTAHPKVLEQNLGLIVQGVTPLVLNIEKTVRRESFKALHLVLSNIDLQKIEPFFDYMCTYLRSSMTHIDRRIQEDSLLFLDLLLICIPERTARDFHKIIPNFLDMISKLRVDSKPGRTLTVNLNSQITSAKWRVKVLYRLQDFLKKYVQYNHIEDTDNSMLAVKKYDSKTLNSYSLFNSSFISTCQLPCFTSSMQNDSQLNEIEKFKCYVDTLMPLLFETWLEACPNPNKESNIETVLNEDGACLLKHTLEVISLIWNIVVYLDNKNPSSNFSVNFNKKYCSLFNQHIFQSFPYVTNIRNRQKSGNDSVFSVFEDTITDSKMVFENLEICYLFIIFNPNVKANSHKTEIINYIERNLTQNTQENVNDAIVKIIETIFSKQITGWTRDIIIANSLLKKIIDTYFENNIPKPFKEKLFILLCHIALNEKLGHFHSNEEFVKWLASLPDILLEKAITVQTINILYKFAVQNNKVFNNAVKPKLPSIIKNLPQIKVSNAKEEHFIYKLFSLFYWIKCWDTESLNLLENQLLNNEYQGDHGKYVFDTLKLRSGGIYQ